MAAYRRVYDSRHLQADCQEPGSAPGTLRSVIEYGRRFVLTLRRRCAIVAKRHATSARPTSGSRLVAVFVPVPVPVRRPPLLVLVASVRPSVCLSVCPVTQSGSPGGNTDVASVRFDPAVRGSINLSTNRRFLYLWCASVRLSVCLSC